MSNQTSAAIACDLNALTAAERERRRTVMAGVVQTMVGRGELHNGFELRFDPGKVDLATLGEWVALERRCCPFLNFKIEIASSAGGVTLALTGPDGVKDFLRAEMSH
ncbi:MAG: hypothetical protein ACLQDV_11500 [Candidatus Binataceae bacterium]